MAPSYAQPITGRLLEKVTKSASFSISRRLAAKHIRTLHSLPAVSEQKWTAKTSTIPQQDTLLYVGNRAFDAFLSDALKTHLQQSVSATLPANTEDILFDNIKTPKVLRALALAAKHTCPTNTATCSLRDEDSQDVDHAEAFLMLVGFIVTWEEYGTRRLRPWMQFVLGKLAEAGLHALITTDAEAPAKKRKSSEKESILERCD
ncbi:hypothetical protein C8R46DRAFT_1209511 [Mycena filopes]|nr:hypothetical protein C8R46DRAFT_1209510 [Mycena filopes]KAJ7183350.1 hypothetical protein C8R46DRAFT_1209511 [Mycena filopes]